MKTYRAIIHEYFEDDTTKEIIYEHQSLEQVLKLFETLDGKSFPVLEIFLSPTPYPSLYIIGGPDMFTFSLAKDKDIRQEIMEIPNPNKSKWRAIGLGYHNFEIYEDHLLNKELTVHTVNHFCITGKWLDSIPFIIKTTLSTT